MSVRAKPSGTVLPMQQATLLPRRNQHTMISNTKKTAFGGRVPQQKSAAKAAHKAGKVLRKDAEALHVEAPTASKPKANARLAQYGFFVIFMLFFYATSSEAKVSMTKEIIVEFDECPAAFVINTTEFIGCDVYSTRYVPISFVPWSLLYTFLTVICVTGLSLIVGYYKLCYHAQSGRFTIATMFDILRGRRRILNVIPELQPYVDAYERIDEHVLITNGWHVHEMVLSIIAQNVSSLLAKKKGATHKHYAMAALLDAYVAGLTVRALGRIRGSQNTDLMSTRVLPAVYLAGIIGSASKSIFNLASAYEEAFGDQDLPEFSAEALDSESMLDLLSSLVQSMKQGMASRIVAAIGRLVVAIIAMSTLGKVSSDELGSLFERIAEMIKPSDKNLFGSVITILEQCSNAYATGSLAAFFGVDKELADADAVLKWCQDMDATSFANRVPGPFCGQPEKSAEWGGELVGLPAAIFCINKAKEVYESRMLSTDGIVRRVEQNAAKAKRNKLASKLVQLTHSKNEMGLRAKPFTIMIAGASSIGKTSLYNVFRKVVGSVYGHPDGDEYVYTINDNLKHWDGFNNWMWAILWDDAACTKNVKGDLGLLGEFLQIISNSQYVVSKAELHNKGNTFMNVDAFFMTCNDPTLDTAEVMTAPEAVLRRVDLVIVPTLKPEYSVNGMLRPGQGEITNTNDMNWWDFKVYKVTIEGNERQTQPVNVRGTDGGVQAQRLFNCREATHTLVGEFNSLNEMNAFLMGETREHILKQKAVMDLSQNLRKAVVRPDGTVDWGAQSDLVPFDTNTIVALVVSTILALFTLIIHCIRQLDWSAYTDQHSTVRVGRFEPGLFYAFYMGMLRSGEWVTRRGIYNIMRVMWLEDTIFSAIRFQHLLGEVLKRSGSSIMHRCVFFAAAWTTIAVRLVILPVVQPVKIIGGMSQRKSINMTMTIAACISGFVALRIVYLYCFGNGSVTGQASDESPKAVWHGATAERAKVTSTSASVANPDSVFKLIQNQTHMAEFTITRGETVIAVLRQNAFEFRSRYWMTASHILADAQDGDVIKISIAGSSNIYGDSGGRIHNDVVCEIPYEQMHIVGAKDLLVFTTNSSMCGKDLTQYFACSGHAVSGGTIGFATKKSESFFVKDAVVNRKCDAPTRFAMKKQEFCLTDHHFEINLGANITQSGDCGGVYVQKIDRPGKDAAPTCILGIHVAAKTSETFSGKKFTMALVPAITKEDLSTAVLALNPQSRHKGVAQFVAQLSSVTDDYDLGKLPIDKLKDTSVFLQKNTNEKLDARVHVFGSIPASKMPTRTKIIEHPYKNKLLEATKLPEGGKVVPKLEDKADFYRAKRHYLGAIGCVPDNVSGQTLAPIVDAYIDDSMARLYHDEGMSEVRVLTKQQAVFGCVEGSLSKYMDGINWSTSAGYPFSGPKSQFRDDSKEAGLSGEMNAMVDEIHKSVRQGKVPPAHLITFDTSFKDEPVKPEKVAMSKYRVIQGCPMGLTIVFRMYFLPIMAFMQSNRIAFEACVGTVAQSSEWAMQREYVTSMCSKFFDGDYKGWDSSMQRAFMMCFFYVSAHIAHLAGYTEQDLLAMATLSQCIVHAWVNFFGDIIRLDGTQPSGQPSTTHSNCITNSIMYRLSYACTVGFDKVGLFRRHVRLLTYGDDSWGGVASDIAHIYNKRVHSLALKRFGITYTNADKSEPVTEDTPLERIDFLKRDWYCDDETGLVFARLSLSTLGAMCTTMKLPTLVDVRDQARATAQSMCDEAFYHGRAIYEQVLGGAEAVLGSLSMLSFDEQVQRFKDNSIYYDNNRDRILAQLGQ